MANRTTASEVDQIMDLPSSFSDTDIERYITAANAKVDNVLGSDTTLSDTLLAEIECYLAAHLIASTRVRQAEREEVDNVYIRYAGEFGKFLESTSYGQAVLMLDTSGKMASSGMKQAGLWAIEGNYD